MFKIIKHVPKSYSRMAKNYSISNYRLGETVEITKKVTEEDAKQFSILSGDTNPIHAGNKGIVHGAFLNGLVSGVIGTKLPGAGTMVVSQNLRFPNKCFVGDSVTVVVELTSIRKFLQVNYKCVVNGKIVLEGDAKLIAEK